MTSVISKVQNGEMTGTEVVSHLQRIESSNCMKYNFHRHYKRQKKQVMIRYLLVSLVFLCICGWFYIMVYRQHTEPYIKSGETNTDAVLYSMEEQMEQLDGFEELYRLAFEGRMVEKEYGTIPIPGLNTTRTLITNKKNRREENSNPQNTYEEKRNRKNLNNGSEMSGNICICTSMTPQGLCIAGNYLLISAYCHTNTHNSVIYVLNKNNHEFVKEIVLKGRQHAGGLAYDKEHGIIWVSTNHEKRASASGFSMRHMLQYDLEKMQEPITYTFEYDLYTLERDSFMTYADGYLYVGHFSNENDSVVQKFRIDKDGGLKTKSGIELGIHKEIAIPEEVMKIPEKTQGFAVYQDKVILTQSYGLTKSELLVHNYSNVMHHTDHRTTINKIVMPQKLQQIYIAGKDLYVLFESAAYAYRAQPLPKVDRVLKLDLDKILRKSM